MNVLDTATRFRKFVQKDTALYSDIQKLNKLLSPYYYEDANVAEIFSTPAYLLKALLIGSFTPNLMIGTTKVRDHGRPKAGGRRVEPPSLNSKEQLMQELLLKGLDPRRTVQMVLDIPREVESRETMKEDLQETFAQMMSCDPREITIHLDPDWKKL